MSGARIGVDALRMCLYIHEMSPRNRRYDMVVWTPGYTMAMHTTQRAAWRAMLREAISSDRGSLLVPPGIVRRAG
jgi:hypothetical protein